MNPELVFTPSGFVAVFNQTLEYAYPNVVIEGELANFKVSKNRWVYFDVKDELSSVKFFGSVYHLPGPLEDGLMIRVGGVPRLHQRFGFKLNLISITPVGEGSIKKAADLLRAKLETEGLFDPLRKRPLPFAPAKIALITAAGSAAAHDFIKITNDRWGGVEIMLADCLVRGGQAPAQITAAIEQINALANLPQLLVITRGGGSADDLAAFNDERLVRAVAASRIPTLVAIGHEVDISLAELAADMRASTPTNAAQVAFPERREVLGDLQHKQKMLAREVTFMAVNIKNNLDQIKLDLRRITEGLVISNRQSLVTSERLISLFDPLAILKRGYAAVSKEGEYISSVEQVNAGDKLKLRFHDGTIGAVVQKRENNGRK